MLEPKEKPCKGNNSKTFGLGCGKPTKYRVYGLGKMCGCYSDFLLNTEAGKLILNKSILKVQKPRLEMQKVEKLDKETKTLKASLINTRMQVHAYVRERDKGKPCVSCGCDWNNNFQAGHYYKAETFETLKFNLENINGQCQKCNLFLDGNFDNYGLNLPSRIGIDKFNELTKLAEVDKHFSKVWNVENLKEVRKLLKENKSFINGKT